MSLYEDIYKKYGLSATQLEIIRLVGSGKKVLEIGSSSGYMSRYFLDNNCKVEVVELDSSAVKKIPKKVTKVFNCSIEDEKVFKLLSTKYNFIVMADVLEHLIDPAKVLINLKKICQDGCKLIISTPNIACWPIRKELFFKGLFEYQDSGILDRTHLHFFTVNSLPKLLKRCGWKVDAFFGTSTRLPFEGFIGKIPPVNFIFQKLIKPSVAGAFANLAYVHFIVVASL